MAATAASSLQLSLRNIPSRNNRLCFSPCTPTVLFRCRPSTCSIVALSSRSANDKSADLPKQLSPKKEKEITEELFRLVKEIEKKKDDKDVSEEDLLKLEHKLQEIMRQNRELVLKIIKPPPAAKKSKKEK